jgi:hypothetical protein
MVSGEENGNHRRAKCGITPPYGVKFTSTISGQRGWS